MDNETINLNPDPLAEFENILRTTGAWCDVIGEGHEQHYFLAKNPKLDTAISLCGYKIKGLKEITRTAVRKKCLVCDLFAVSRMEARNKRQAEAQAHENAKPVRAKYKQTTFL